MTLQKGGVGFGWCNNMNRENPSVCACERLQLSLLPCSSLPGAEEGFTGTVGPPLVCVSTLTPYTPLCCFTTPSVRMAAALELVLNAAHVSPHLLFFFFVLLNPSIPSSLSLT